MLCNTPFYARTHLLYVQLSLGIFCCSTAPSSCSCIAFICCVCGLQALLHLRNGTIFAGGLNCGTALQRFPEPCVSLIPILTLIQEGSAASLFLTLVSRFLQSTLLKALAGKLGHSGLQVHGNIMYNGTPLTEFLPQRTAVYVEQEDQHLPELTVRETFDFAARCQGVGTKAGRLPAKDDAWLQ